jgi:hypothetical protein
LGILVVVTAIHLKLVTKRLSSYRTLKREQFRHLHCNIVVLNLGGLSTLVSIIQ